MEQPFAYTPNPTRVIFGAGALSQSLPAELSRLHISRPFLLLSNSTRTPQASAQSLTALLAASNIATAGVSTDAAMHTPTHVTERALAAFARAGADGVVSVGGGSAVGLGKAIAVRTGVSHVCVPTTYSGSEMTDVLGETETETETDQAGTGTGTDGEKRKKKKKKTTRSDDRIRPATVIYDVDLTVTMPPGLSATSGVNAIAHAVEALYARNTNPIVTLLALEGVRSLAAALPTIVANPSDLPARSAALYGAWLCGTALGSVGMALHHKLCHALGGTLDLPHAATHTVVLPHALAYNASALPPETLSRLADALPGRIEEINDEKNSNMT
ncbi:putative maleylacetate [Diplodia seriata]|uniref:Putative maleylacetate n=1 Tax=Diplodia seriata TaxID=420778 RepID=A0A0G2DX70_9PEZI|nr:putative maleylacetate [Diplodia seriata]